MEKEEWIGNLQRRRDFFVVLSAEGINARRLCAQKWKLL